MSTDLPLTWVVRPHIPGTEHLTIEVRMRDGIENKLAIGHLRVQLASRSEHIVIPVALVPSGLPRGSPASPN